VAGNLRLNVAGFEIGKDIDIQMTGSADTKGAGASPSETCIEMQWNALGHPALFPTMKAELVLSPLPSGETQLELCGTYLPPLGHVGMVLDVMMGHRLAEASVHRFVHDVAARLDHDLA
jgi:hypothetical protein